MKKFLTNSFDKVYLTVEFDAANQWIYNNWTGVLPTEKVIQGCRATIDGVVVFQQIKSVNEAEAHLNEVVTKLGGTAATT